MEINEAFTNVKEDTVSLAMTGVTMFQLGVWRVLETNYSKDRLCFVLQQKTCSCKLMNNEKINLNCCKDRVRVILCGPRFTTVAESRYAAVEGEWMLSSGHKRGQNTSCQTI